VDLYEYQGKQLFASAGLPVPRSRVAQSVTDVAALAGEMGLPLVLKAQVRAGGRGKAGGVKIVTTPQECAAEAERIMALTIKDKPVEALLLEEPVAIARELYVAIVLSRPDHGPLLLVSTRGGMDIEQVARETPQALVRAPIDPLLGLRDYQVRDMVLAAGLKGETGAQFGSVLRGLWRLYRERDASLVEVNPLVVTQDGAVVCLDSKVTIDDNALGRQAELAALRAPGDERERRAREAGLHYLSLDGNVGVLGNGAGMVMSTLDLIAAAGGSAADFCDVGGGAQAASVEAALRIIFDDLRVRSVLVSIFGGITRGDEVARGLIAALSPAGEAVPGAAAGLGETPAARPHPPVVVRLDGNNAAEGRALLAQAALPGLEAAASADDAVARVVRLAAEVTA
jgi:succinyl-CoA synthetase beta subunit